MGSLSCLTLMHHIGTHKLGQKRAEHVGKETIAIVKCDVVYPIPRHALIVLCTSFPGVLGILQK